MDSENKMEEKIGRALWVGVASAGALLVFGLAYLAFGQQGVDQQIGGFAIMAGIAVLLLTPAVRVLLMLLHYVRVRDLDYALISLFVLVMMALGYIFGAA